MFAAAAAAAELGRRGWAALFVAFNPGLVYSASHELTEPLSAALLLGGLLAYTRGRRGVAIACFALLVLSKEPFATVPVVLAACELVRRRVRPLESVALAAAVLPAALWWTYVRIHLGHWFTTAGHDAFVAPFSGWKRAIDVAAAHTYDADPTQNQFGEATLVVFVALAGLLVLTAAVAVVTRSHAAVAYLPLFAIVACLGEAGTIYERDILRNASVALVLVPFILQAFVRERPG
jgi:4-amino-4-deoxy-L-arabinose transferase-like glycosyltransferase